MPTRRWRLVCFFLLLILAGAPAIADVFTVTIATDAVGVDGDCTLREAIDAVNTAASADCPATFAPGIDRIHFAIPGAAPKTITPSGTDLPAFIVPVFVDGLTQPPNGGPAATTQNGPSLLDRDGQDVVRVETGPPDRDSRYRLTVAAVVASASIGPGCRVGQTEVARPSTPRSRP